ncbi:unnamed protein product [Closterium sp. NIES-54]
MPYHAQPTPPSPLSPPPSSLPTPPSPLPSPIIPSLSVHPPPPLLPRPCPPPPHHPPSQDCDVITTFWDQWEKAPSVAFGARSRRNMARGSHGQVAPTAEALANPTTNFAANTTVSNMLLKQLILRITTLESGIRQMKNDIPGTSQQPEQPATPNKEPAPTIFDLGSNSAAPTHNHILPHLESLFIITPLHPTRQSACARHRSEDRDIGRSGWRITPSIRQRFGHDTDPTSTSSCRSDSPTHPLHS